MPVSKQTLAFWLLALGLLGACHRHAPDQAPSPDTTAAPKDSTHTAGAAWATLGVEVYHGSGDTAFELGSWFSTKAGTQLRIATLKYYLSNPVLIDSAGRRVALGSWYRLMNVANPESWAFALPRAPAGRYRTLELMIGVDSAASFSLDHTGQLAPDSGMWWAWNTGYLHSRTEGKLGRNGLLVWHVGGSGAPAANQRVMRLPLAAGGMLPLADSAQGHIRVQANLYRLFDGPALPAAMPAIEDPVAGSTIADAWQRIFSTDSIWVE